MCLLFAAAEIERLKQLEVENQEELKTSQSK